MKKLLARRRTKPRCMSSQKKNMSKKRERKNKKRNLMRMLSLKARTRVTKLFSNRESHLPTKTKLTLNKERGQLPNQRKSRSQTKVTIIALKKLMIKTMSPVKMTPQKKRKIWMSRIQTHNKGCGRAT